MSNGTWKGALVLRPLLVPLESVELDPENARTHPRANIEAIKSSLQTFGQRKPIVTGAGTVFAGNGTVLAARELGWDEIAAVPSDDLSSNALRAFALADNQTSDLSEWEAEKLRAAVKSLPQSLSLATGFSPEAISALSTMSLPSTPRGREGKVDADGGGTRGLLISKEQGEVIDRAVEKMRAQENDPSMSVGRVLELLAAEFLS